MADVKKMTKKDWFAVLEGIVNKSDYADKKGALEFITHEVELLDKKSGKAKETKTQKAHGAIMTAIIEVLADKGKPVTITDMLTDTRLQSYTEETKDGKKTVAMTNQKLSSMVKKLVDNGEIVRTEEKKKAYFSLSQAEEESTKGEDTENENTAEDTEQTAEGEDENGTENE